MARRDDGLAGICGTADAARLVQNASVKKLVLAHIGPELAQHGDMGKGIGDVK
tara:strand:+ start:528 stop:686 length:159 start_codon:yes stop_codon:yes gene_type:complete